MKQRSSSVVYWPNDVKDIRWWRVLLEALPFKVMGRSKFVSPFRIEFWLRGTPLVELFRHTELGRHRGVCVSTDLSSYVPLLRKPWSGLGRWLACAAIFSYAWNNRRLIKFSH